MKLLAQANSTDPDPGILIGSTVFATHPAVFKMGNRTCSNFRTSVQIFMVYKVFILSGYPSNLELWRSVGFLSSQQLILNKNKNRALLKFMSHLRTKHQKSESCHPCLAQRDKTISEVNFPFHIFRKVVFCLALYTQKK